jgi:streptomycin 6-kinase
MDGRGESGVRTSAATAPGAGGRVWLAALPALLEELAASWHLRLDRDLGGGTVSSVTEVTTAEGTPAVLKLTPSGAGRELAALKAWGGHGAPELLRADVARGALLLERIVPGTYRLAADPEGVARVLHALHVEPPPGLPSLGDAVRRRLRRAAAEGRAPGRKLGWALTKLAELEQDAPPPALLHGDFDDRNLRVCARSGLRAIDPLACAGDPAYDAGSWVHGDRRPGRRARLDGIAAATGLPHDRVRDWAAIVGVHGRNPGRSNA